MTAVTLLRKPRTEAIFIETGFGMMAIRVIDIQKLIHTIAATRVRFLLTYCAIVL
jgi:hypothetical protein